MKRKIRLSEFIDNVKTELIEAAQEGSENPFFAIEGVELETEFSIEATGKAGVSFFVDLEGTTKGTQSHRIKLRLKPIPPPVDPLIADGITWIEDSNGGMYSTAETLPEIDPDIVEA